MTLASLHQQGWSTRAMAGLIGLYAVLFGILLVVLAFKALRQTACKRMTAGSTMRSQAESADLGYCGRR